MPFLKLTTLAKPSCIASHLRTKKILKSPKLPNLRFIDRMNLIRLNWNFSAGHVTESTWPVMFLRVVNALTAMEQVITARLL